MRRKKKKISYLYLAVIAVLWLACEFLMSRGTQLKFWTNDTVFDQDIIMDFSEGWSAERSSDSIDLARLYQYMDDHDLDTVSVSRRMPETVPRDTYLMFRSQDLFFTVSVNSTQMYSYMEKPAWYAGNSHGLDYHTIQLDPSCGGKKVTITAHRIYQDSGGFDDMYVGDGGIYYHAEIQKYLPAFIVSLVIITVGVILLYLSVAALHQQTAMNRSFLAFAVLTILIGIWALTEAGIGVLLVGHPDVWQAAGRWVLPAIPYPMMLMVEGWLSKPNAAYHKAAGYMELLMIAMCLPAWFVYHLDLKQTRYLVDLMLFLSAGISLTVFLKDARERLGLRDGSRYRNLLLGLIILFVSGCMDLIADARDLYPVGDGTQHVRVGVIFAILLFTVEYFSQLSSRLAEATMTETFKQMALRDSLTGIGNRSAMEQRMTFFRSQEQKGELEGLAVGSVDLNYLKQVNDSKGHASGDKMIQKTADILSHSLAGIGDAYRTGGDEFIFFISAVPIEESIETAEQRVKEEMKRQGVSLAWGIEVWKPGDERTLEEVLQIADRKMYAMKTDMKAERTD